MLFNDNYKTIIQTCKGIFKDKGSKFIAYAYPFKNESDLKEIITKLKIQHPKARHHCFAYRLSTERSVFRVNDDGEPSGTAGRPILNVLLSKDVTNILVVVVRYFGGTLLGVPGLINAYKSATEDALNQADIIEKTVQDIYQVKFEYLQMNDVMKIIKDEKLENFDQVFELDCKMNLAIDQSSVNRIVHLLEEFPEVKLIYRRTI